MNSKRNHLQPRYTVAITILIIALVGTLSGLLGFYFTRSNRMKPSSEFVKPDPLPKYFGIDIDDTFYIEDEQMFKKNIEAFKLLKSNGVTPFFCTGRDLSTARRLLGDNFYNETGYPGYPGVYTNGTLVYGSDGTIIKLTKFSTQFLDKFQKFVLDNNLQSKATFFADSGTFSLSKLDDDVISFIRSKKMNDPTPIPFDQLKHKNIISIAFPSKGFEIEGLKEGLDYKLKYVYEIIAQLSPGESTKKNGIESLLGHFKTTSDYCAYIGDGPNDMEAMEFCKTSFAVGNANDEVKRKAKWVLDLNHDQGAFEKAVKLLYSD